MKPSALLAILLLLAATLRGGSVDVFLAASDDATLQPLVAQLSAPGSETFASWRFWTGTLRGKKVVLARTEGDPLNAVATTTLAIRHYAPRLIITFGTARAHDPALQAGDLVVSRQFAAFDGFISPSTPLDGGVAPLKWERLPHLLATRGEKETPAYTFPADATALALAAKLVRPGARTITGTLGSANQRNAEADRVAWLHAHWGTSCEDGESAHIAGCAQLLSTPVIGLRVIRAPETESGAPDAAAAQAAAGAALQLLEALK